MLKLQHFIYVYVNLPKNARNIFARVFICTPPPSVDVTDHVCTEPQTLHG